MSSILTCKCTECLHQSRVECVTKDCECCSYEDHYAML